ncbi:MAG: DMT family transporter [Gammaproteobacteria bacterium]|nr:DMT family transporter [Gammaproteobacteria bacterium]
MNKLSKNLQGMLLMTLSMALFTVADMNLKLASQTVTTGQITLTLGIGGTLSFWLLLRHQKQPLFSPVIFEPAVLLRTIGEIIATVFIILALTYSSFTGVTAIIQTLPLLLTLASFLFLGEKVGVHRMSAIAVGFIGMLLIVRPGADGFDAYSLFGVAAVLGMTLRDLGSRLAASHHSSVRLVVYGTMGQILAGLGFMVFEPAPTWPSFDAWLHLLGLVFFASIAIVVITKAMRTGEVSAVSPFRYTRLFFGILAGVLIFDDQLDNYMLSGCAIILLAGLYVWQREHQKITTP